MARPTRGGTKASSEFLSVGLYLKQALEYRPAQEVEATINSPGCVQELQRWKSSCLDHERHWMWIVGSFSKSGTMMCEKDWKHFIGIMTKNRDVVIDDSNNATDDSPDLRTTFMKQWKSSAESIFPALTAELLSEYLDNEADWCYEVCMRLLVTVCDDLRRHPSDGYFAKLLEAACETPKSLNTPQKRGRAAPTPQRKGVARTPAGGRQISPLIGNVNVTPRPSQAHSPSQSTSSSPLSAALEGSTSRVVKRRRVSTTCLSGLRGSAASTAGSEGASCSWKARFMSEVERSVGLDEENRRLKEELSVAQATHAEASDEVQQLRAKLVAIRDILNP